MLRSKGANQKSICELNPNGLAGGSERRLIYIPILHSEHDMGSLAASAKSAYVDHLGQKLWERHVAAIHEMWSGIRHRIIALKLPYGKTYLYQDGLPVCGKETEIINHLAGEGSPNHEILADLMKKGATLMGTEDPQLLLAEYTHLKEMLAAEGAQKEALREQYKEKADALLQERDQFICHRIRSTLPVGTVGILFIGLLHRVDECLPSDIQLSYLIHRLPFRRSFEMEVIAG